MEKIDLKMVLRHRATGKEIEFPVLAICNEYSNVTFSALESEYDGYNRLPGSILDDTVSEYDVFVEINNQRYIYDGLVMGRDMRAIKAEGLKDK